MSNLKFILLEKKKDEEWCLFIYLFVYLNRP